MNKVSADRMITEAERMKEKGYEWAVKISNVPIWYMKSIFENEIVRSGVPRLSLGRMLTEDYPNERLEYYAPIDVHIRALLMAWAGYHTPPVLPVPVVITLDSKRYPALKGQTWNGEPAIQFDWHGQAPDCDMFRVDRDTYCVSPTSSSYFMKNRSAKAELVATVMVVPEE